MSGRIEVICGPMFSGKSERLILELRKLPYFNKSVSLYKPRLDSRTDEVVSRSGFEMQCRAVAHSRDIAYIESLLASDVVAIDEAQFFDNGLIGEVLELAKFGRRVIVAGLDTDFRGETFGPMGGLLALADDVRKLRAACGVCREPASMTQRLIRGQPAPANSPLIVLGGIGDDTYEPRCRTHHEVPDA